MDALNWCYTGMVYISSHGVESDLPSPDCVLPSQQAVPPLFAQQECQDLTRLLESAGDEASGTSIVHTRIVARVLLRKGIPRHAMRPT